ADTPSGRLYKALVDTKKATRVFDFSQSGREPGLMLFGATLLKEASTDDAQKAALDVLENVAARPITAAELERARTRMLSDFDLTLNDITRLAITMSSAIAVGDWRLFFLSRDLLKKVTVADVQRVATTYFKQSNRTIGTFL